MPHTDAELTGRETINQRWPYDGPHSEDTVLEAARAIHELVEYLNNATFGGTKKTLRYSPQVARILGSLGSGLSGLDQLLEQLMVAETRIGKDPKAHDERRDRPASQSANEAVEHIGQARKLLAQTSSALLSASTAAFRIGHDS